MGAWQSSLEGLGSLMAHATDGKPPLTSSMRYWGNWKRNALGVLISAACLGLIFWRVNLNELINAISGFQWGWSLFGIVSLSLGYIMRIVRWSSLLRAAGTNVPPSRCAAAFLGSIALNNTLPMRLGDVMRALVFPSAIGIGRITATGSLVMERLVDLMTLLACLMIGLALTSKAQLPEWLLGTAVGLALSGSVTLILFFLFSGRLSGWVERWVYKTAHSRYERILLALKDLLVGVDSMSRLPVLFSLFGLSMLVWAGEAGLYWALLWGFELKVGAGAALVVMAIATLATLVPSSPGYVGPFHLAAFSAVIMLGGTPSQAASFAVVAHLGVWMPTTVAGALALLFNPQLFGRAKAMAVKESGEIQN
jgi:uncharacterized protein (TIRG00374 family)